MLRRTLTALRVSPYCVFLQDMAKKHDLSGIPLKERAAITSRMYRSLTPEQMRSLQSRANKLTFPALDAFNRFQRQHAFRLTHLKNAQRQRVIGNMWRKLQDGKTKSRRKTAVKVTKKTSKKLKIRKTSKKTSATRKLKIRKTSKKTSATKKLKIRKTSKKTSATKKKANMKKIGKSGKATNAKKMMKKTAAKTFHAASKIVKKAAGKRQSLRHR